MKEVNHRKEQMENHPSPRKFLHDFATPLTIAKGALRKTLKEIETDQGGDRELCKDRLKKAVKAIEELEALHADFRASIP